MWWDPYVPPQPRLEFPVPPALEARRDIRPLLDVVRSPPRVRVRRHHTREGVVRRVRRRRREGAGGARRNVCPETGRAKDARTRHRQRLQDDTRTVRGHGAAHLLHTDSLPLGAAVARRTEELHLQLPPLSDRQVLVLQGGLQRRVQGVQAVVQAGGRWRVHDPLQVLPHRRPDPRAGRPVGLVEARGGGEEPQEPSAVPDAEGGVQNLRDDFEEVHPNLPPLYRQEAGLT